MNENPKEDTGKDLTVAGQDIDIFQRFDALDDKVIISELENRVVDAWVYHFKPKNAPEVWGMGKAGIDGCMIALGKKGIALREEDVRHEIDPTNAQYVLFTAKVSKHLIDKKGDEAMVESAIGTKRQWTKMLLKNGDVVVDPFWFEKGSIKALRNAKARLIPEEIKAKIITFAKSKGKVKEIKNDERSGIGRKPGEDGETDTPVTAEQKAKIGKLEAILTDKLDVEPSVLVNQFGKDFKGKTLEEINTLDAAYWLSKLDSRIKKEEDKGKKTMEKEADTPENLAAHKEELSFVLKQYRDFGGDFTQRESDELDGAETQADYKALLEKWRARREKIAPPEPGTAK